MAGPRGLILAAPASGSGKTVMTLGLLRAFARNGIAVAGAKAGPDYIDPGFHMAAARRPSVNLDIWAMRPASLHQALYHTPADFVICEGVMGLFDGAGKGGDLGSTADLAAHIGWPVILIVDAAKQSASAAALVRGFAMHRPDVPLSGVILNRVGSDRHAGMLTAALNKALPDLPILGIVPRSAALALPERYLGLVLAPEHTALDEFLDGAAGVLETSVHLPALAALARNLPPMPRQTIPDKPPGKRIAVARDTAFAFVYRHVLDEWRRAGAEIVPFSPLNDEGPDGQADFVFLPGGYPELHASTLAAATRFLTSLRASAARQTTIYGECGGYMVLGHALIDGAGIRHPMAGLLPVVTSLAAPRRHLGYRQAVGLAGPWAGTAMRGHEFHYASVVEADEAPPVWALSDSDGQPLGTAGHAVGTVSGSFFHIIDRAS